MPLSPRPMRRFGYRSSTPAPMIAAMMLMRFIWKPATLVNCALRRRSPVRLSRTLAGIAGKVWKCNGSCTSLTAFHNGSQTGCHIGSMSHEQDSSRPLRPSLATAIDFLYRGVDIAVGQTGETDLPIGLMAAEALQPI